MNIKVFILFLLPILFSCGSTNFAKRRYTKGVYVEKRTSAGTTKKIEKSKESIAIKTKEDLKEKNSKSSIIEEETESQISKTKPQPIEIGKDTPNELVKEIPKQENTNLPPEQEDGEVLRKNGGEKKLAKPMKKWSIFALASAVAIILFSLILGLVINRVFFILMIFTIYLSIPTSITGGVLSLRYGKYYDKDKAFPFLIISIVALAISIIALAVLFLVIL